MITNTLKNKFSGIHLVILIIYVSVILVITRIGIGSFIPVLSLPKIASIFIGAGFFILSLYRLDLAICLFIFLSPFHLVVKEIYPSIITDIWRDIFFLVLVAAWFIQICIRKLPMPRKNIINVLVVLYLLWNVLAIFRSINLKVGIAGFRFMIRFTLIYFIALSTIRGEKEIRRYINVMLATGIVVAIIGVVQFLLVSVLGIVKPGTSIDFTRKYATTGSYMYPTIGMQRAISVFAGTSDFGFFLAFMLGFIFSFAFMKEHKLKSSKKLLYFSMGLLIIAIFFSMSRSSIISFLIICTAIIFLKKSVKVIPWLIASIILLALVLPFSVQKLFEPIYTFSDPYFQGIKSPYLWNTFLQAPLLGRGYSVYGSIATKMGISQTGTIRIGSVDNDFLQTSIQVGLIGLLLRNFIWAIFLRNSYRGAKNSPDDDYYNAICTAGFGILLGMMIASLHLSVWNYIALDANYYVLGAITTFIYQQGRKDENRYKCVVSNLRRRINKYCQSG